MSITLATPFSPGDLDSGHTYDRFQIDGVLVDFDQRSLTVRGVYGTMGIDGKFVRGKAAKRETLVVSDPQLFSDLTNSPVLEGESIYRAIRRLAFVALQTKIVQLSGVLDDVQ